MDFRNNVIHAPAGLLAVAQHYRLNQDIEEECALGTAGLRKHDYPLFRQWTIERLRACDIITKKQWLESVRLAREEYEAPEVAFPVRRPYLVVHSFLALSFPTSTPI